MKPATILLQERIERFESSLVEKQKRIEQLENALTGEQLDRVNLNNQLSTANDAVKVLREALEGADCYCLHGSDGNYKCQRCEALSTTQPSQKTNICSCGAPFDSPGKGGCSAVHSDILSNNDSELLDWLEKNIVQCSIIGPVPNDNQYWIFFDEYEVSGPTPRQAIRNAMKKGGE